MRLGVVAVMAKVIEFYVPDRLRQRRLWTPPEQCGKVIEFPRTEITGVTSELKSDFTELRVAGGERDIAPATLSSSAHPFCRLANASVLLD
jgi:hypothetical protein